MGYGEDDESGFAKRQCFQFEVKEQALSKTIKLTFIIRKIGEGDGRGIGEEGLLHILSFLLIHKEESYLVTSPLDHHLPAENVRPSCDSQGGRHLHYYVVILWEVDDSFYQANSVDGASEAWIWNFVLFSPRFFEWSSLAIGPNKDHRSIKYH